MLILTTNSAVMLYTFMLGKNAGIQIFHFSLISIPFVIYEKDKKEHLYIGIIFTTICWIVSSYVSSNFIAITIKNDFIPYIHKLTSIMSFVIIILGLSYYYFSNEENKKYLYISNKKLEKKTQSLQQANQEIAKKAKVEADMELGKELQKKYLTTLPPHLPTHSNIQFATYYSSAKTLGGDYYYADWTDDILRYALVDVTGKGLTAALMTISIHALIQRLFKKTPPVRLEQMMAHLNNDYISLPVVKTACDTFLMSLDLRDCLIKIDT
jgi:hypothetical protein